MPCVPWIIRWGPSGSASIRVLRDVQPRQRHPRRSQEDADRGDHAARRPDADAGYEVDSLVFATGFDAMTGALTEHRHPRAGRAERCGDGGRPGPADLSRHRPSPASPISSPSPAPAAPPVLQQHDRLHRAARGTGIRRLASPTCPRHGRDGIEATAEARGGVGRPRQRGGPHHALSPRQVLVHGRRTCRGKPAHLHALHRPARRLPGRSRERRRRRKATRGSR